jgi:hypothetical protein
MALVVASEGLLVASRPNCCSAPYFLKVEYVMLSQLILIFLVVGSYPWASQCYFSWEHDFGSIDEEEWCLACCGARDGSVRPNHHRKLIYPACAMLLELVVGPSFQPLRISILALSTYLLLRGCAIEAKRSLMPMSSQ